MAETDETFDKVESGLSLNYPLAVRFLKKGGFIMLFGKPCKIVEITISKTGKHGHAKAIITGIDVLTGKKYEDFAPSSRGDDIPNVTRKEYTLVDIAADGFVTLMVEDGSTRDDLTLPTEEDYREMVGKLKEAFDGGKEVLVSVIAAVGKEKIIAFRETGS